MDFTQLHRKNIRIHRVLIFTLSLLSVGACSTIPSVKHEPHHWPKGEAFFGAPSDIKPYDSLGLVRSRADYPSLTNDDDEHILCINYFNKAVKDLVKYAKKMGGDAVINVKSVVFLMDGKTDSFDRAECIDEGHEGQALAVGQAIRYKKIEKTSKQ
jgi:hypothetical protein